MNRKQHENVKALAEYVRTKVTDDEFDIELIMDRRSCGTVGCLMHHATQLFPEYGYTTVVNSGFGRIVNRKTGRRSGLISTATEIFGFFCASEMALDSPFSRGYYQARYGSPPSRGQAAQALLDVAEDYLLLQGGKYTDEP